MLYITLGDQPSGIYLGQVIDVCDFLSQNYNANIRLVAFISGRDFRKNAQKIKSRYGKAIVLPMLPKLKNWYLNRFTLALICLFTGERAAICRNVLATKLALSLKPMGLMKKVCFDGRGAIAAEWKEYDVVADKALLDAITDLERDAVINSDFRIAVSEKLVAYWQSRYNYHADRHVVIPCTLSTNFSINLPSAPEIEGYRQALGYKTQDIVLVYAGSTAGWQSFSLLYNFLSPLLKTNPSVKVLFLSKEDKNNRTLREEFKDQVFIKWIQPEEVSKHLVAADYGFLLREPSVTNQVAAPTKFAEYLVAGLPVIISESVGDYTNFVLEHHCGVVMKDAECSVSLKKQNFVEKARINKLAKQYFLKESAIIREQYNILLKGVAD